MTKEKRGRKKTPDIPAFFQNMEECETFFGAESGSLAQIKLSFPEFVKADGRISVQPLVGWLINVFSQPSEGDSENLKGRQLYEYARGEREKIRLMKEKNQLIDANLVERIAKTCLAIVKASNDRIFATEMPAEVAGLDAMAIRQYALKANERVFELVDQKYDEMIKEGEKE